MLHAQAQFGMYNVKTLYSCCLFQSVFDFGRLLLVGCTLHLCLLGALNAQFSSSMSHTAHVHEALK